MDGKAKDDDDGHQHRREQLLAGWKGTINSEGYSWNSTIDKKQFKKWQKKVEYANPNVQHCQPTSLQTVRVVQTGLWARIGKRAGF